MSENQAGEHSAQAKREAAKRAKEFWAQHGQYETVDLTGEEEKPKETE
jgi:hypothetical protein